MLTKLKARLLTKVKVTPNGCWEWQGSLSAKGYGKLKWYGIDLRAHRASWIVHKGPIPDDISVLHKCDNRPCINPEHLFLGTDQDNTNDRLNKGKFNWGINAKLTEEQVTEIKHLLDTTAYTHLDIAEIFKVSRPTITAINNNRNWSWLCHN